LQVLLYNTDIMARPTDYNEKMLDKVKEYINSCTDTEVKNKIKVKLPTIEGLASYINVNRDTIYEWCKVHKAFSDIIESLREKQVESLINNGLSGDYNSTIAKVLLAKHGYRDAQELTGAEGKSLIPEQLSQEEINKLKNLL